MQTVSTTVSSRKSCRAGEVRDDTAMSRTDHGLRTTIHPGSLMTGRGALRRRSPRGLQSEPRDLGLFTFVGIRVARNFMAGVVLHCLLIVAEALFVV